MRNLRAGVLGLGYAGLEHAKAYAADPRTELVAIATRSEERLAAAREQVQAPVTVTDYGEVLARDDVDMVSIATPDHVHAEQIVAALEAGKHVLAEKPLCVSLGEARSITAAVERSGRKLLTGQILRFAPYFRALKDIYDDGDLGEAFFVEADYLHDLTPLLAGPSWRTDPEHPQNMVLGGGCHPIDLLRWMFGDVACVYAVGTKKSMAAQPFPHDTILISLAFASGVVGKVLISVGCKRPYQLNFGVYGTRGTLLNSRLFLERLRLRDFMEMPLDIPEEFPHYREEVGHLVDCVLNDEAPLVDAREGAKTVATCVAAIWSLERGEVVAVPEV
jgi:predicted dehydrogenase